MRSDNTEFGKCVKNGYINVNLYSPKKIFFCFVLHFQRSNKYYEFLEFIDLNK